MGDLTQALLLVGYFQDLPGPTGKNKVIGCPGAYPDYGFCLGDLGNTASSLGKLFNIDF